MLRRTRIVATLGPATDSDERLEAILRAGVDVARVNFSHGAAEEHLARVARFREAARRVGKFAGVLADLPGPKLRVKLPVPRELTAGDTILFSLSAEPIDVTDVTLTEPEVLADVRPGQRMLRRRPAATRSRRGFRRSARPASSPEECCSQQGSEPS